MIVFWLEIVSAMIAGAAAVLGVLWLRRAPRHVPSSAGRQAHLAAKAVARDEEDDCDPDDSDLDREFAFDGRHLLASYSACDPNAIRDLVGLTAAFHAAVRASGATLLHAIEHTFPPDGMTAVAVLSESHASIHTYPEHDSCFIDIFTCGNSCNVEAFDVALRTFLRPQTYSHRIIRRHEEMIDESPVANEAAVGRLRAVPR